MIQRWKVTCSYDGTDFSGWQTQPNGCAVQDVIEARLQYLFDQPTRIHASGRTDAGVHARGQVFHFDGKWRGDGDTLRHAIRTTMPVSISIDEVVPVREDFHARFSATGKLYTYRLYEGDVPPHLGRFVAPLRLRDPDFDLMENTLARFVGWHDFAAFACNRGKPYEDTIRYISLAEMKRNGPLAEIQFEGNGFLYRMVRMLVGAMLEVCRGRLDLNEIDTLLGGHVRTNEIKTAAANGLTLEKVFYQNRNYPPPESF